MSGFIRLLDSNKELVMDSVSVEYEDSFCLESFGDLAKAHYNFGPEKGKHGFIIARVQTWDHKQPGKAFYSYYHAFHLNKILFQTQVYLGKKLIHRLHVLNPLTNTDIIGNVQYFLVQKKECKSQTLSGDSAKIETIAEEDAPNSAGGQEHSNRNKKPIPLKIDTNSPSRMKIRPGPASATIKEVENFQPQTWTLSTGAVVEAKDEEFDDAAVPKKKKLSLRPRVSLASAKRGNNTMEMNSITEEYVNVPFTPLSAPPILIPEPFIPGQNNLPSPDQPQKAVSAYTPYAPLLSSDSPSGRRHTGVNIVTKKQKAMSIRRQPAKIDLRAGQVTRFAQPVPESELVKIAPTSYGRRRALSYANAVTTAGTKASLKEWLEMVKNDDSSKDKDFDKVKPFGTPASALSISPVKKSPVKPGLPSPIREEPGEALLLAPEAQEETENVDEFEWDAVLFATDTDFLEQSKIRLFFKANAIVPEDAMLFKMKPYTGEEPAPDVEIIMEDQIVAIQRTNN